jgi:hypothetical protein
MAKYQLWLFSILRGMAIQLIDSTSLVPGSAPESYFKMGICYFPANNTSLRRKSKDWIRTLCQSGAVCLSMNCCFIELTLNIQLSEYPFQSRIHPIRARTHHPPHLRRASLHIWLHLRCWSRLLRLLNQDIMSERGGMSIHELLFHWANTEYSTKCVGLVQHMQRYTTKTQLVTYS